MSDSTPPKLSAKEKKDRFSKKTFCILDDLSPLSVVWPRHVADDFPNLGLYIYKIYTKHMEHSA